MGKLHVRFGKGSNGRGPKTRLVPGINAVDDLLTWRLTDVRHQYGEDWEDPDAPLFPSERHDPIPGDALESAPKRCGVASLTQLPADCLAGAGASPHTGCATTARPRSPSKGSA